MVEDKELMLVVASKVKAYIKARGMRTSESFLADLSSAVGFVIDGAIAEAERDGRKTVMDKDL